MNKRSQAGGGRRPRPRRLVRERARCAIAASSATATPSRRGDRGRLAGLPARGRGAHGRADLRGQRRRGARQRRRDLPGLPRHDPQARRTVNLQTYVYWRGDIAGEVAECAVRERAGRASRSTCSSTRSARRRWSATLVERDARRRGERRAVPPAAALRAAAPEQPHAPQAARRRRRGRHDRRRRDRGGVDRRRPGPRPLARHARPRPGPVVRGLQGAFAENWLEATGDVLVGDGYLPELEPVATTAGRCRSCARARASATRTSRRSTSSRSPRARAARPHGRVLRPAPRVRRGAVRRGRARRRRPRARPGPAHRQGLRPASPAGRPTTAARRAASSSTSTARRCCTPRRCRRRRLGVGRLGELRQPLVPAPRRGDAVRAVRARSRSSSPRQFERGPRRSPSGCEPGRWADRPLRQRATERATKLIRREL